jgi:hypothetical protein
MTEKPRFQIFAAPTMIDLLVKMQQLAYPFAQLKYFGRNEGDYSTYQDQDIVTQSTFIAVFDLAPLYVFMLDDVQMTEFDPDTNENDDNNGITMSA